MSTSTRRDPGPARARRAQTHLGAGAALLALLALSPLALGAQAKPSATPGMSELPLVSSHALDLAEPSDLAIDETGKVLWTVTDRPGKVHQLALDGTVVRTLKFVGEDLEGIAYDRADRTLWVAEENRREIVHLDLEGNELSRHALGLTGKKNSGIEGLCLDAKGRMFALNEKEPGLFLELGADRTIAVRRTVSFAGDYSGITYDRLRNRFWIVSDQSQGLYLCDQKASVVRSYRLPFPKAEGVAVDEAEKRVYVVSDSENRLYVFRLED